jgi:hypothetical protein
MRPTHQHFFQRVTLCCILAYLLLAAVILTTSSCAHNLPARDSEEWQAKVRAGREAWEKHRSHRGPDPAR